MTAFLPSPGGRDGMKIEISMRYQNHQEKRHIMPSRGIAWSRGKKLITYYSRDGKRDGMNLGKSTR